MSASGIVAKAQEVQQQSIRFVHGLEWGGTFNIYQISYSLFLTEEQYLAEKNSKGTIHHMNGFVNYKAGIGLRRMEALAYVGYQGLYKNIRMLPVGVRATVFNRPDREGLFGFADGCVAIMLERKDKLSTAMAIGGGYRIRIADRIWMDHTLALSNAIVSPTEVYDPYSNCIVKPENLRESRANSLGLRFSAALVF